MYLYEIKLYAQCIHCLNYYERKNATREQEQLLVCKWYWACHMQKDIPGSTQDISSKQAQLAPLSKDEEHQVDLAAAMAVYRSAMTRFLHLLDQSYNPSTHLSLSGLLDKT